MEYFYMGIFSSIFNWVLEKILSPVFNFISKLLGSALGWIFNEVLGPLLKDVFWPLFKELVDLIMQILAGVIYGIYAEILNIIDNMNSVFNYLIGLENITYKGKNIPLLEAIFQIDGMRTAFLMVSVIGLSIAFIAAIYATIQSTLDLDFENKRPISKVLSAFFRCFVQLLTVELLVIFLVQLSGLLLKAVDQALNVIGGGSGSTTLARMIFVISSMNACKSDPALNLNGSNAAAVGITDRVRKLFYNTGNGSLSYTDVDAVERYFDLAEFDYLIGFVLSIFLMIIMAICLVIFVQRLFDMLMLYLVSPFFIGMMPLDDGEKFGKWKELFIGKCFSGFSMVIVMKLYIMICPSVLGSQVVFSPTSKELDYLTKMVFILGGAWAVVKSGPIFMSLLSADVSTAERDVSIGVTTELRSRADSTIARIDQSRRQWQQERQMKRQQEKAASNESNSGQAYNGGNSSGSSVTSSKPPKGIGESKKTKT